MPCFRLATWSERSSVSSAAGWSKLWCSSSPGTCRHRATRRPCSSCLAPGTRCVRRRRARGSSARPSLRTRSRRRTEGHGCKPLTPLTNTAPETAKSPHRSYDSRKLAHRIDLDVRARSPPSAERSQIVRRPAARPRRCRCRADRRPSPRRRIDAESDERGAHHRRRGLAAAAVVAELTDRQSRRESVPAENRS